MENRNVLGGEHLMFATDYPHTASTWPKSRDVVDRDTAQLAPELRRALVHDNVIKLFNLPSPVAV